MWRQWIHRERRVNIFWHRIPWPFLLFFPPSSCGFMAYLPVAESHLAMRGDLWQVFAEILTGAPGGMGSPAGFLVGPDGPGGPASCGGDITPLGGLLRCECQVGLVVHKIV